MLLLLNEFQFAEFLNFHWEMDKIEIKYGSTLECSGWNLILKWFKNLITKCDDDVVVVGTFWFFFSCRKRVLHLILFRI